MKRPPRDRIDGVLLLDKPLGLSSNDALVRARRMLNAEKAGHGGTLDPLATGLLPILCGEATKFAHGLLDADKTYLAELVLGEITTGGDGEGEVIERRPVTCDEAAVRAACAAFVGEIDQVPPMHSALKRDGRPLYELAREGVVVEREARRVVIHEIEVVGVSLPRVTIRVHCSKGTYIRSLAVDIGERLGCGAHLGGLRREAVGTLALDPPLTVAGAVTLDALEALDAPQRRARLLPFDRLLGRLRRIDLPAAEAARFSNGARIRISPRIASPDSAVADGAAPGHGAVIESSSVRVYADERLLGVATLIDGLLAPLRLVAPHSSHPPAAAIESDRTTLEIPS